MQTRREFLKIAGLATLAISPLANVFAEIKEKTEETKPKRIILTIDDGPRETMEQILSQLGVEEKQVTFYCIGKKLETEEGQSYAKQAIIFGHIIGNHGYIWPHPPYTKITFSKAKSEIEKTEEIINKVYEEVGTPRPEKYFRFPFGAVAPKVKEYLQEQGFTIQGWDTDSLDWRYYSKRKKLSLDTIMNNCRQAKNEDIVLVHDLPITAEYLIPIFADSKEYQLVLPA